MIVGKHPEVSCDYGSGAQADQAAMALWNFGFPSEGMRIPEFEAKRCAGRVKEGGPQREF